MAKRSCNGEAFVRALEAGTAHLERNATAINQLNVFPVPDGDTGTNMLLTMRAALEELARSPDRSLSAVTRSAAHGALMGARGNSGVILSQLLRGLAEVLKGEATLNATNFAAALKEASLTAYRGMVAPVEGTILTVAREAAEAAHRLLQRVRPRKARSRRKVQPKWRGHGGTMAMLARDPYGPCGAALFEPRPEGRGYP